MEIGNSSAPVDVYQAYSSYQQSTKVPRTHPAMLRGFSCLYTQESLLTVLGGHYGMPGIELGQSCEIVPAPDVSIF